MYLRIREACERKNITLVDLHRLCGISVRNLEWYVKQERQPSLAHVEKMAKALEVTPEWLVSWSD